MVARVRETRRGFVGSLAVAAGGALTTGATARAAQPTAAAARRAFATAFVGRVDGSNAYVAILKDGTKVGGYVCNDGPGGAWIKYTHLRRGRAPLIAGNGDVIGRVTITGDRATGTVEVSGTRHAFSAKRTSAEHPGLYFAVGVERNRVKVGGWIVLPDGSQRGAIARVSTTTLRPLATSPAPRLTLQDDESVRLGDDTDQHPPVVEPQKLVVINIIAVLIGLLLPAIP
jgi:hypothetical protein